MKHLKQKFEKIYALYEAKREFFSDKIHAWKEKNKLDFYTHAKNLLVKAETHADLIKGMIEKNEDANSQQLKSEIKHFKKTFKELHEMTKPAWRQWTEAIVVAGCVAFVMRTFIFGLYHVPTGSAEPNILVGDRLWGNKFVYYVAPVKKGDLVIFDKPDFMYDQSSALNMFWQQYIGFPIPLLGLGSGPESWVKRVIALPGDTVEGRVEEGKTVVYVNGKRLEEPYVNHYPLIRIKKKTGFFNRDAVGLFPIPSFLHAQNKIRIYSYDPNKSLAEQPFYHMTEDELIKDNTDGSYLLEHPFTPNFNRFGDSYDQFGPFTLPAGKYWVMGDSRKNSEDSRYWGLLDEKLIRGRASLIMWSIDSEEPFWLFEFLKHPISFWTKLVRWNRCFKLLK